MGAAARPGGRLLSVMGAINWDICLFEERFARPGEEVPVRSVEECSGGKGGNVAVAAARILGPGRAAFVGALGSDAVCSSQLAELEREGVVVDGVIRIPGTQSGRAYIVIDAEGRKTIHTHFGANERITPADVESGAATKTIFRTDVMVVMDPPVKSAEAAARLAKKSGARVIYSPGVRSQDGIAGIQEVLKFVDFLVLDKIELMNLYESTEEEKAVLMALKRHPGMEVVATLGPEGCVVSSRGAAHRAPGFDVQQLGSPVVNTTGCGDAFLGVFASYLMMGSEPLEAAKMANVAGAIKATRVETRGSPTRKELEGTLERKPKASVGAR